MKKQRLHKIQVEEIAKLQLTGLVAGGRNEVSMLHGTNEIVSVLVQSEVDFEKMAVTLQDRMSGEDDADDYDDESQ